MRLQRVFVTYGSHNSSNLHVEDHNILIEKKTKSNQIEFYPRFDWQQIESAYFISVAHVVTLCLSRSPYT